MKKLQAVCHDHSTLISGTIHEADALGCELHSPSSESSPAFPRKTNVHLELHDEASGKSLTVLVRLVGVSRKNGSWAYRIRWTECPSLVSSA